MVVGGHQPLVASHRARIESKAGYKTSVPKRYEFYIKIRELTHKDAGRRRSHQDEQNPHDPLVQEVYRESPLECSSTNRISLLETE